MKKFVFVFLSVSILSGCAAVMTQQLSDARREFANDKFTESAENFSGGADIQSQNNLQLLITGLADFTAKNYSQSDAAFEEFNRRNIDTTSGSILREATSLIGGQLSNDYKPSMMDSLFVSYYQIWDAIGDGRYDDVRVIINQSYARQQEMSREYAELVEKNKNRITDNNNEALSKITEQNATWAAYSDIMNPALMYLSGIWFLNDADFNNARTYLNRANGMTPNNPFIKSDLELAEQNTRPANTTWIFIESGFAPILHEETMSLPVITNNGIIFTSIAVAEPIFWNGRTTINGAKHLADVNAMFMTEFNEYRINDALRAFAAASARVVAQAVAYNSDSKFAGLIGLGSTIFSITTNNAEVRSWATLPEQIYVIRQHTPKSRLIELKSGDKIVANINLESSGNNLVYVRLTGGTPNIHTMKLN